MNQLKVLSPGIILSLAIAIPSWFLGQLFPIIGGPVFAILSGIIITSIRRIPSIKDGITFTSKKLLQYAIVFLGFEMNLFNIVAVGGQSLLVMVFTLSAAFLTAYLLGKALKIQGNTSTLIGVGTAICGGSAIAATAPVIHADNKEISRSISTIFLFNILAVFLFPPLGHLLGMGDTGFGMWAGTAINDTSSVVAASASWSATAGNNTALTFATIVKLTRTLMIIPITLILSIYTSRKENGSFKGGNFNIKKVFPLFILGFITAALINTFLPIPIMLSSALGNLGKFFIVMAMAAIGLNTHIKDLIASGIKPILLGLGCWFAVASVSLLVQVFTHMW